MFDWLFGSGGKQKQQIQDQNDQAFKDQFVANYLNDKIGAQRGNFSGINDTDWQSTMNSLGTYRDQANDAYKNSSNVLSDYEKENRYNYFGDGLLGAILNPIGQTASAGVDLATGQYGKNGRDAASDLGALAETALTFLPVAGGAMKAMKLGKAGAATERAINSLPGLTLTGAGMGAADAYRQGGQDTQPLDVLGGAAMGGLFGGGISAASRIGNNFVMNRGLKRNNVGGAYDALTSSGISPYQASLMAMDENAIRRAGMRSLVPQSTFGKVALGGGLLYGGSRLLNSGGEQQPMNYNDYSSMAQDPYAQYGMGY